MPILEMHDISKSFGGVKALKGVDLVLENGEVLGLVGENGAGKSTLMKILSGAINNDTGHIFIKNKEFLIKSPQDSIKAGISLIYQELNLARDLSVAENVFIGSYPIKNKVINWNYMFNETDHLISELGGKFSSRERVSNLKVAQQQLVEIAKAIKKDSNIIVFDEPSAVLGKTDSLILFDLIRSLKQKGVSIIYISHRLDEVLSLTDSIMVLRDGECVCRDSTNNFDMERLVSEMTGRSFKDMWPEKNIDNLDSQIVLEVRNLTCKKNRIHDVSFSVRKGEVLGLAGLVGSGRSEIARCIFGADKIDSGDIYLYEKKVRIKSPWHAINQKIAFVTEDRKNQGLLLERPIIQNITLTLLKCFVRFIAINKRNELSRVFLLIKKLSIKTNDVNNPVKSLSGGNQQKVVLAKWLHIEPDILILDEPTHGVDIGAKAEIYRIIEDLRKEGKAIILISSEFSEIMALSTRLVIIKEGTTLQTLTRDQAMNNTGLLEALS